MKNLKNAVIKQSKTELKNSIAKLKAIKKEEDLRTMERWECKRAKPYAGTTQERKEKIAGYFLKRNGENLQKEIEKITEVENAKKPPQDIIVSVYWTRSRTWGWNPTAEDNYGNSSGSIGGCGYCKLSTAVADVLNKNLYLLKKLYLLKDKHMRTDRQKLFGYGTATNDAYGILPCFAGGVGMTSLENILKKFFKISVASTNNSYTLVIKV